MRLYTPEECAQWCERQGVALDDRRKPTREFAQKHVLHAKFPASFTQLLWFSRCVESALQPRESCLVWISDWGIFPSNENQHLYYRLRQSYGDHRLLHEAPGHLCLQYEAAEVVTLVHLCILHGWDVHLVPAVGYARAFVSHDEWVEIGLDDPSQLDETRAALEQARIQVTVQSH
jgi:hypothetical protein